MINTVTVKNSWILNIIARRLCEAAPSNFTLSYSPREDVKANFYIDITNCYSRKSKVLDIGLFTHLHEDCPSEIKEKWLSLDHIVHMCSRYSKMFEPYYPAEKMSVIPPIEIPQGFDLKKPRIGVVQRGLHVGKGFEFMKRISNNKTLRNFKFTFVGSGWNEVISLFKKNEISVEYYENEDYSYYPDMYHSFDYLLIPSLWEGGPMSTVEAFATGVPIISSDVGWINCDFDVDFTYPPNDEAALIDILQLIHTKLKSRRNKVEKFNYSDYANKVMEIVNELS